MSKNRVIVEAVLAGQSHAVVAAKYGISKVWVGKLMARWRHGGFDAVGVLNSLCEVYPSLKGQTVMATKEYEVRFASID